MRSRAVVAGLVILIAAACAVYLFEYEQGDPNPKAEATPINSEAAADVARGVGLAPRANIPESASVPEAAKPLTLLDRYTSSNNLLELVNQLRADADAGNVEAIRVIGNAYAECLSYSLYPELLDPKRFDPPFGEPDRTIALGLQDKQRQRCADLISSSGAAYAKDMELAINRTVGLNDLIGQAEQLLDEDLDRSKDPSLALTKDQIAVLSRKIALSKNPEAIVKLALSQYASQDGRRTDTHAWILVACDFGHDCSAIGLWMRRNCVFDKRCVNGNFREFLRRKILTPDQFDSVVRREREILQAIKSGDVSHLFH